MVHGSAGISRSYFPEGPSSASKAGADSLLGSLLVLGLPVVALGGHEVRGLKGAQPPPWFSASVAV